jgi:hypothetical protein
MPRTHNATGRARKSTGSIHTAPDVANTSRRKKRSTPQEPWIWHTRSMRESPAFRVLSLAARRVLDRIEIELLSHAGKDNGKLPCTYDDFEEYGVHRHAIGPALRELEALGFIEITRRGRAGNSEFRLPHLFRITHKPAGDALATDDWSEITTMEMAEEIRRKARLKQNPSGGKRTGTHGGNRTTKWRSPVADSSTTGIVRSPPLLSISCLGRAVGGGGGRKGEDNGLDPNDPGPIPEFLRR